MISRKIKAFAKRLSNREPGRKKKNRDSEISQYNAAVLALAIAKKKLVITVVGANDGKINDPIFALIEKFLRDDAEMVLIEPQSFLIDSIKTNYAFVEKKHVFNVAIGDEPTLKMYRVREKFWDRTASGEKKAWPTYRSATGVTSMQKENVVEWARKHVKSAADINEIVEEFDVPGCRLGQLLAANHLPMEIDVLQVDAEGEDDSVIYCCDLEMTKPTILFFENKNLSAERLARLLDYLRSLRYEVFQLKRDTLAIRSGR